MAIHSPLQRANTACRYSAPSAEPPETLQPALPMFLPSSLRRPQRLRAGLAAIALCAPLCALLPACSPRYDWRTIQSGEGGYAALYPGKPSQAARDVAIAGRRLPMTMEAARIDDTLFAVGVVTLPEDDPAMRRAALDAMQKGLLANLGGALAEPAQTRDVTVMSAAQPPVPMPAIEIQAAAVSPQDQTRRRLTARLVASGRRVYQAVVLEAGEAALDRRQAEQVEQFLSGFHPY